MRNNFTPERITEINNGYGLDGGGYSFENPDADHPLANTGVLLWDDPDLDYFLGSDVVPHEHRYASCMVLVFAAYDGSYTFPNAWLDDDDDKITKVCEGVTYGTDRECNCHGQPNDGQTPWLYTGNCMDVPYPNCDRCDGDGYLDSPGGTWAIYAYID
jgi:hypothetical protein